MLTHERRSDFDQQGFIRLRGAFSRADAVAMEERLWGALERRHGVRRDDPSSWKIPLGIGLQSLRSHRVFGPIGGAALFAALDDLVGEGCWMPPKHGGQFLVSFPVTEGSADGARAIWHTDFPYLLPDDRVAGALVFSFVGDVPERTGGTLVLAGSPMMIGDVVIGHPGLLHTPSPNYGDRPRFARVQRIRSAR